MGVDIDTYRGRIGTFKHSCGQDVVTIVCVINFSRGLKYVGAVLFIGILLLIAGIEANPGPGRLLSYFFVAIVVVVLGLLLQGAESEEHRFFAVCILVATLLLCYASENASRSHKTKAEENREGDETPKQTSRATDSILQRDAVSPLRVGSQEPDVTVQLHDDHGPEILQQTVSSLNVQESDTTVPQASSMLKKAEENREDKCIDDSLQLPTLDSDKSSRALPRSRPLGEPSAEQSEDEYTAQQVSLDDTADYQNKQVAVLSPESSTIQENENREDQSKEDNGIQMSTFFPDQSTGAIPKSRTPGDIAENRKHQNKDDGIQQPTLGADPSSGAIPKSRPRREAAGDSIGIEHDHGNLIKLSVQSVSVDTSGSISKEEEYFVSQVLTFKACRDVFRELFIHMATKDGASINKTVELLQNNETLIKALNAKQRGLWSIDDWDLNHFATVLKNGFKSELKNNESKAIECIRTIRNNVIHSPNSSLTFEKYDDSRKALENATTTLCSRLNSSAKARFTTIIKKYEPERLNMDTIPQDFKDFRGEGYALLLKMLEVPRIYNAFKEALGKNITNPDTGRFVLKQIKEVKVCITFEGHTEDKTKIENGQSQILKIFESEAEQNNVSVILSIVVSRIKEDLNSMQDVEFRGTESGSIILNIHVFSITALLEVLQYIESQPLQSKLDVIADELSKKYDFQNPLRLSAALSTQTLLCLYKDFVLDESDEGNTPFSSADAPKETIYRRTGTTDSDIGLTADDLKEGTLDKDRDENKSQCWEDVETVNDAHSLLDKGLLPDRDRLSVMVLRHGMKSKIVVLVCENICKTIEAASPEFLHVFGAYDKENRLHFVVYIENESIPNSELDLDYEILFRSCKKNEQGDHNDMFAESEGELVAEESVALGKTVNFISKQFMDKHKYLSVITARKILSEGRENLCIVMYVHPCTDKYSSIPQTEEPLPTEIQGYKVVVRNGVFKTATKTATEYHDNLRMGCKITSNHVNGFGTLGGFIDHPEYGLCGFTCAHVVCSSEQMINLKRNKRLKWSTSDQCSVYQPSRDTMSVGSVVEAIYTEGGGSGSAGVDLALFQIENRPPVSGNFPRCNSNEKLRYDMGKTWGKSRITSSAPEVQKFGVVTGITKGNVQFDGMSVRELPFVTKSALHSVDTILYNQYEIVNDTRHFCEQGDSGGLVFMKDCFNELICIGMVNGVLDTVHPFHGVVTPITDILRELNMQNLKHFIKELTLDNLENRLSEHAAATHVQMQASLQSMQSHINDRVSTAENNMLAKIMEVQLAIQRDVQSSMSQMYAFFQKQTPDSSTITEGNNRDDK